MSRESSFISASTYTFDNLPYEAELKLQVTVKDSYGGVAATQELQLPPTQITWSGEKHITEDIIVPIGATLRINPGTHVIFDGNYGITVYGIILINADNGARVTLDSPTSTVGSWKGIRLENTSGCVVQAADFRYARAGLALVGTNQTVMSCLFEKVEYGIHVYSCAPVIEGCQFTDCTMYGIKEDAGGQPTVSNCSFTHPSGTAYVGDYYDEELTILEPEQINGLHGDPANKDNTGTNN